MTSKFLETIHDRIETFMIDEVACPYVVGVHVANVMPDISQDEFVHILQSCPMWKVISVQHSRLVDASLVDGAATYSVILQFVSDPWKKGGLLFYLLFQSVRRDNADKHYIQLSFPDGECWDILRPRL